LFISELGVGLARALQYSTFRETGPCPVSERLAKQLSQNNSASFGLTGESVSVKFLLS